MISVVKDDFHKSELLMYGRIIEKYLKNNNVKDMGKLTKQQINELTHLINVAQEKLFIVFSKDK